MIFYIFSNDTNESTVVNKTVVVKPPIHVEKKPNPIAEISTGHEAEVQQQTESMKIFFILIVLGLSLSYT